MINYTNPAGLVTEAVTRYTNAKIAGFCSGGIFPKMWAKRSMGIDYNRVQYDYVGLNHLNFISNITIDGRPITEAEFDTLAETNDDVGLALQKLLGCLTSPYLQYFYKTNQKTDELKNKKQTRGEYVQDLEKNVFAAYADPNNSDIPEALFQRGGGGYSEVAMNFVNAVYNNIDTEMVVNVPNKGAVDFLPNDGVVEINCLVNKRGMAPIRKLYVPEPCWGIISEVKNYEMLAVEAAVEGNVTKMKQALLAHPLVREYSIIEKLVPELLEGSKEYLPQFNK
jgi:6-phospho-beta-glucosidase